MLVSVTSIVACGGGGGGRTPATSLQEGTPSRQASPLPCRTPGSPPHQLAPACLTEEPLRRPLTHPARTSPLGGVGPCCQMGPGNSAECQLIGGSRREAREGVTGDGPCDPRRQVGVAKEVCAHETQPGGAPRAIPGGLQGTGTWRTQRQLSWRHRHWRKGGESTAGLERGPDAGPGHHPSSSSPGAQSRHAALDGPPLPDQPPPGALPSAGLTCPLMDAGLRLEVGSPGGNLQSALAAG